MTNLQIIALTLVILRLASVAFLVAVLAQQIRLLRTTKTDYPSTRYALLAIVSIGVLSTIIPIIINVSTLFERGYAGAFLIPYAFSNAISLAGMSVGWWFMYRTVEKEQFKQKGERTKLLSELREAKK